MLGQPIDFGGQLMGVPALGGQPPTNFVSTHGQTEQQVFGRQLLRRRIVEKMPLGGPQGLDHLDRKVLRPAVDFHGCRLKLGPTSPHGGDVDAPGCREQRGPTLRLSQQTQ